MALIETLAVLGLIGGFVYLIAARLTGGQPQQAITGARWACAHYAIEHTTRVVVRRSAPGTAKVLDEHVIAVIADDDPDYDARFLEAMAQARERVALFESEGP